MSEQPLMCLAHKVPLPCRDCGGPLFAPSPEPVAVSVPQHVYTRAGRAAVCGIPGDDHNCDQMACSSVEHVLFRLPHTIDEKPDKEALARIDAVIGRLDTTLKFSARPWPIEVLEDARLELQRFRALLSNQESVS